MKPFIAIFLLLASLTCFTSCEKDEGKLPHISFKTGADYTSDDVTVDVGTTLKMGIEASKAEKKDPLKKFNISVSVDAGAATSVINEDLSGDDGDNFEYDFTTIPPALAGQTVEYIFTVTNRDGLVNQVSLTVTLQ